MNKKEKLKQLSIATRLCDLKIPESQLGFIVDLLKILEKQDDIGAKRVFKIAIRNEVFK